MVIAYVGTLVAGVFVGYGVCWWWWFRRTTYEFAQEDGAPLPHLFLQINKGGKISFFNNDQKGGRDLDISFDAGALEPDQSVVESGNKITVSKDKTKTVMLKKNATPGEVFRFTWSAEGVPVAPGSQIIIQGGP